MGHLKRAFLFTLVLATLLGLAAPAMAATDATITLNTPQTISCGKAAGYTFRFTPKSSGWYSFYSTGAKCEPFGNIEDAQGYALSSYNCVDYGTDNFHVVCYLSAGETYHLYCKECDNQDCSFKVQVKKATAKATQIQIPDQSIMRYIDPDIYTMGWSFAVSFLPNLAVPEKITWTSSNPAVAHIEYTHDSSYYVAMESAGYTVVTGKTESGLTVQLPITVVPSPVGDDLVSYESAGRGLICELRDNGHMTVFGSGGQGYSWGDDYGSQITQVHIPEGVTQLYSYSLYKFTALESIVLPKSLKRIDAGAFYQSGLKTICFRGSAPQTSRYLFRDLDATVYYPAEDPSWTQAYRDSFEGNITWKSYRSNAAGTLKKVDGLWKHYVGDVYLPITTLVKFSGSWYYVEDGVVNTSFTGFMSFNGARYYVKNGKVATGTTGLVKHGGVWYYIVKGKAVQTTGLVKHNEEWFYVKNGIVASDVTTLVKFNGEWFYVAGGKVASMTTALVKFNGEWFYVKNGKVASKTTTLVKYSGSWYYVQNGTLASDFTGFVPFNNSRYYVKNGKVASGTTGLVKDEDAWYYIIKGKLAAGTTKLVKHYGEWFYVKKGTVAFDVTSLVKHCGGWYYVKNGKVASKTTTTVKFNGRWYHVKNGKVTSETTPLVKVNGSWYYTKNGNIAFDISTMVNHYGGWYYVKNGKVTPYTAGNKQTSSLGDDKFIGKVLEIQDNSVLVEPIIGEWERNSSSQIRFSFATIEQLNPDPGYYVLIHYNGEIQESSPASIEATGWSYAQDLRLIPYDQQWLDPERTKVDEDGIPTELVIDAIYADCFIATPIIPLPHQIKVNGTLSEEWCPGDHVSITYENCRYEEGSVRIEVDLLTVAASTFQLESDTAYKPVLYLYPEQEQEVTVQLTPKGGFTCTYPAYEKGWQVTAAPDGTLTDRKGQTYNYLYWEGKLDTEYDFSQGFCVKGEDTAAFLEDALAKLGLNRREANEFIVYWLPQMQENPYNIISFQSDAYTNAAPLNISPAPDTIIRVFMTYLPSDTFVKLPAQTLTAPERNGFTVIEWGGTEIGGAEKIGGDTRYPMLDVGAKI